MVRTMTSANDHVLLLLDHWNNELIEKLEDRGVGEATGADPRWFRIEYDLARLLPELYCGAWAAFWPTDSSIPPIPRLEREPRALRATAHRFGARFAIQSFYDDSEWLVYFGDIHA